MKFVNKFHSNSILPFSICRIKSGSVIQTKHFDIKMSLEIRQAKSFFFTLLGYVFCIFSFFHFFHLTYNYKLQLFVTKHFKYKTLIYLCHAPPKICVFICTRGGGEGNGYSLLQMFFGCGGICKSGIFAVADAFFDAVVSARVRYSLLRMLFSCQSCIIASAIYLFHDLQILSSTNCICNLFLVFICA